jgi:hypothetical protein
VDDAAHAKREPSMKPTTLIERYADWHNGAAVEPQQRLVRNVALAGRESKNGYAYSEAALQGAVALYEHKPVFLDHAADKSRPQERSTRDLVGSIVNARFETGRIRGDIRVLDTESGRTFLALAESDAPGVGMSHVVLAERNGDGATVEKIHDVISVDAVVGPATTRTIRESREQSGDSREQERTTTGQETDTTTESQGGGGDACSPASPLCSLHSAHGRDEIELLQEQISALKAERDELRMRLDRLEAEAQSCASQAQVARLLAEAQLPDFAVTRPFMEQLATAADDAARRVLIGERSTLVRRAAQSRPNSAERATDQDRRNSNAEFVAAIRAGRGPVGAVVW